MPATAVSHLRYAVLIIASPLLLSGCLYHQYTSPQIEGTLSHAGKPLTGATVSVTDVGKKIVSSQTDANGHFALHPEGNWQVFIPIGPQDLRIHWTLALDTPEGELSLYEGYRSGGVFSGYSKRDNLVLACDTASPVANPLEPEAKTYCLPVSP
jgi:hypothetical protein